MKWEYSKQVIGAFFILLCAYFLLVGSLWLLQINNLINFQTEINGDILPLLASVPFVALYLLVLIAATAGYARGAIMAKELPFKTILENKLKDIKMSSATIKTKIRSGAVVYEDTPFTWALDDIISSRISILPVVDRDKNEVKGVITCADLLRKLQEELRSLREEASGDNTTGGQAAVSLQKRLADCRIGDLPPQAPVIVKCDDDLQAVLSRMIEKQHTKVIVSEIDNTCTGTVDALDLIAEIYEKGA
ncbi:CBS domain-containing protein [Pelotomaculum propionicicum]|uniref:CBS domain-containing protein n=1 Tax=Pelotomaculum propionicicum TaxID=258475 RepID=UPI003B7DCAE7